MEKMFHVSSTLGFCVEEGEDDKPGEDDKVGEDDKPGEDDVPCRKGKLFRQDI